MIFADTIRATPLSEQRGAPEMMVCSGCGDRVHEGRSIGKLWGNACARPAWRSRRIAERED